MTFGRNSVTEFLRADRVRSVFIKEGRKDERLARIAEEAISKGLPVIETAEDKLDAMAGGVVHQGAAALLKPYEYAELDKVLSDWEGKDPILILLDGLEDVRNLGAIVRTAECAGAAAVLLPKHKSPPVTAAAMKTAAGAFAYLPVCQTGNIRQTLEGLKEKASGSWARIWMGKASIMRPISRGLWSSSWARKGRASRLSPENSVTSVSVSR